MHQLIYASQASLPFSDETLAALLRQARQANERLGLTGVLLFNEGYFVQVLEGSAAAVAGLYERLLADRRHHGLVQLASGPIAARRFGEWAMSFRALNAAQMARMRGYLTPEQLAGRQQQHPLADELLLQIIESFMQNPGVTPYGGG
jgi:hypothetical protein